MTSVQNESKRQQRTGNFAPAPMLVQMTEQELSNFFGQVASPGTLSVHAVATEETNGPRHGSERSVTKPHVSHGVPVFAGAAGIPRSESYLAASKPRTE